MSITKSTNIRESANHIFCLSFLYVLQLNVQYPTPNFSSPISPFKNKVKNEQNLLNYISTPLTCWQIFSECSPMKNRVKLNVFNIALSTLYRPMSPSHRNQSVDLLDLSKTELLYN